MHRSLALVTFALSLTGLVGTVPRELGGAPAGAAPRVAELSPDAGPGGGEADRADKGRAPGQDAAVPDRDAADPARDAAVPARDAADPARDALDPDSASNESKKRALARKYYRKGQRLYQKRRFGEAIRALRQASALWPRAEIDFNIALCHLELGERIEAATFLRRSLAGASPRERQALPRPLRELLAEVGVVMVRVSRKEAEIWLDGRPRGRARLEQVVLPGDVSVEIRIKGRPVVRKLLRVDPGAVVLWELDEVALKVGLPPGHKAGKGQGAQAGRTPGRWWAGEGWHRRPRVHLAWLVGTGSLALAAAGTALGLGFKTRSLNEDYFRDPSLPLRSEGLRYQTSTNILWGLAGAAAVSGAIIALFTRYRGEGKERATPSAVTLQPVLGPGGVGLTGRF